MSRRCRSVTIAWYSPLRRSSSSAYELASIEVELFLCIHGTHT